MCLAFKNSNKRITVVSNGNIVSNDIDEHLLGIDALVPLKGISIMGGFKARQQKYTDSLFGKMTDVQVRNFRKDCVHLMLRCGAGTGMRLI